MSTNPYASPTETTPRPQESEARVAARWCVRVALLILLVPATYNFICFNFSDGAIRIESSFRIFYRIVNLVGFVAISVAVWLLGLGALEFLTGGFHTVFARNSKLHDWKAALYSILRRGPAFALLGAILWVIWVAAFYQVGIDFYIVSVPIGIASHLLAAGLYVPLLYRWYKMERSSEPQMTS